MQRHDDRCRCGSRVAALLGLLIATALQWERVFGQDLRIEHVTVVSPESSRAMPDVNVTVHDGRIAAVVPAALAANR